MKQLLLILAVVALVGCGTTSWVSDPSDPNSVKIEKAIREELKKPTGELTKADLEKITRFYLNKSQLTDVKGLENLTQLEQLNLKNNSDLTKAQINQLQKALPKCKIYSNPTK